MSQEEDLKTKQKENAELRESFLWALNSLSGKKCLISMHENLNVEATNRGFDQDIELMHVENLVTPIVTHPIATVRMEDCISLSFKLKKDC